MLLKATLSACFADKLLHGEAVALGMICESHISYRRGMISESDLNEISAYIIDHFNKADLPHFAYSDIWRTDAA